MPIAYLDSAKLPDSSELSPVLFYPPEIRLYRPTTSVAEPVYFWPAPAPSIFFTGSGSSSYKKKALNHKKCKQNSFFLTRKISFIFSICFLNSLFINVGTNEENFIEKFACFI